MSEAFCVQAEVAIGGQLRRPIDGCVPVIAQFCDCKVWPARAAAADVETARFDGDRAGGRYSFFGFETDAAPAIHLFAVIDRAIRTEMTLFKTINPALRSVRLRRASASSHGPRTA